MPEQPAAAATKSKHGHAASQAQPAPRKVRFNVGGYWPLLDRCLHRVCPRTWPTYGYWARVSNKLGMVFQEFNILLRGSALSVAMSIMSPDH